MIEYKWHNQQFILSHNRVIYWQNQKALFVSDMHIGKTGHFRKAGIAVPQDIYKEDLMRFFNCLQQFNVQQVIIVGDLFHSQANLEFEWFSKWRNDFKNINFTLVKGNHDNIQDAWLFNNKIEQVNELEIDNFRFIHDDKSNETDTPTFSGHIHPAVVLNGSGRQSITLPCFYFSKNRCVLPAFSAFTGMHKLKITKKDVVFGITNEGVIKL